MSKELLYQAANVCEQLNITQWTLRNWYAWEKKQLNSNIISETYLPKPQILEHQKGKPRVWTQEQIEQLKEYKKNIITGRNGIFGAYSNPTHFETKKYKKSLQSK